MIYNTHGDPTPIVAHDALDGIAFHNNLINDKRGINDHGESLKTRAMELKEIAEHIFVPATDISDEEIYNGFGFEQIDKDLFGASRRDNNTVGAVRGTPNAVSDILDKSLYGTSWHHVDDRPTAGNTHTVSDYTSLEQAISNAADRDILLLEAGDYEISSPLTINKTLTIKSDTPHNVTLRYTGDQKTPLFEMNPMGNLTLININLTGGKSQYAFASLQGSMSSLYNLSVENCTIENFDYILKGYKYSFAEDISFTKSSFKNCQNGIELSEEIEDKGEYNAENIVINGCQFDGISANVIDYYRGGYDESTVGGNLLVSNTTFINCGAAEKNGILLNTYGIINVSIVNNTFKNNDVQKVAQLWGAKNNSHFNNVITNSGKINVEENLKLKTFY